MINLDYTNIDRRICVCANCGFVYRTPVIDQIEASLLYRDKYRENILKHSTADQYFDKIISLKDDESDLAMKINWLKSQIGERFSGRSAVLDIGCGAGMFLYKFFQQFPTWDAAGVEPGRVFGETAARRLGKPIAIQEYFPGLFGKRFQLITLIQVLEHVADPAKLLAGTVDDLTPDGLVYIEVPSVRDFSVLPPDHDRFMSPHLAFFSPNSMRNMCARAGYAVIHIELSTTARGKVDLRALCHPSRDAKSFPLLKDDVSMALGERKSFQLKLTKKLP